MTDKPEYSAEFITSVEKLNLFYHIHSTNAEVMKNAGVLMDKLDDPKVEAVSVDFMREWLAAMADRTQTIDALMHICQDNFIGEAKDWLENSSSEEQIKMRDSIMTPILGQMEEILTESAEERTQRILIEMLHIHD